MFLKMAAASRLNRSLGAGDGKSNIPNNSLRNEDDVEYDITFPSPGKRRSDFSTAKEPVVYLLGWAGCKHRHLSKYGAVYEEQGCITVKYIAPPKYFFQPKLSGSVLEDHAFTLVNLIEDLKLEEHPLFFHVFSNGGAFVYSLMSRQIRDRVEIMSKVRTTRDKMIRFFETLDLEMQHVASTIFFFNQSTDQSHLVLASTIGGASFWSSSPHVQHLVMYREQYMKSVVDFMQSCLSGKALEQDKVVAP
ncbi:uncharacterized protein LOC135390516 [Ornithodoros turicata]|uniref:uncharacterized protein LOC135390516 n=1 Tax=Ornithodoros turicata TaxID=34597 RepID=UPI003138DA64